ncbi:Zn-dependent hydrolase [Hyphomicrobium sp.]|uniref:Zn-dependent hydrolase n=1 Tax=Hyphomicrobium sp. TaxID=82 RepID=UPI000FBB1325|nr:Zn-dependent hydrolase [Hyphomicrobium sp.]RUP09903.1 MAG: Zn-dependent hydrolase [Hyphomicrobium sp.]
MPTNLSINSQRLWDSLMDTAKFGGTEKGGICRLALSDEDRQVRDWFKAQCETLGCTVRVDEAGNMFAVRPGRRNELAPIAMGSHLDTQPTGGKFDGVLGVLGALEVLRTLHEQDYQTNAPIEVVNWTNEEGSRFPPAMMASGVFAGALTAEYIYQQTDRDGVTFLEALERIGYRGPMKAGDHKFSAMFELHIEQGPVLESEKKIVGVVTGVQGMRWYEVTIKGEDAHTGATPMWLRKNALVGAARMIEVVDAIGQKHQPGVATVGLIENKPNSRNVVPGEVFFTVDLRHPDENTLDVMEAELRAALEASLAPLRLSYEEKRIWSSRAVKFAPELIDCVRRAAAKSNFGMRDMVSGAGHDAAYIARVAPTTMIFVPCEGGLSHNEAESTSYDECAAGAQVLLDAVLAYDEMLAGETRK